MGRPFIVYDDDEQEEDQQTSTSYDSWKVDAQKALQALGISDSADVSAVLAYLYSQRRAAFLPQCEPSHGALPLLSTRIGGLPYLLPHESWPSNGGTALCFLWQFRVHELPAAVQQALGRGVGLLQVFLSEALDEEEGNGSWYLVRVLDEGQLVPRDRSEVVPEPGTLVLEERRVTSYTRALDFPCVEDALEHMPVGLRPDLLVQVVDVLQNSGLLQTLSGDKLLGWPNWCQGPEWCTAEDDGARFMQLLQVEGSVVPFAVGDGGTLLLQRHPRNSDEWDVSWACC